MQEQADTELMLPVVDSQARLEKALDVGVPAQPIRHGDILIVQRVLDAGVAATLRAAASNGEGGVAAAAVAAGMSASAGAREDLPKPAVSHYRAGATHTLSTIDLVDFNIAAMCMSGLVFRYSI